MIKPYLVTLFMCLSVLGTAFAQTWKPLGPNESDNPSVTFSAFTTIAIAPDGTPYIAYNDNSHSEKVTVKRFDGAKWILVGQPGFTEDYSSNIGLVFSPDGTPYVIYGISTNQVLTNVKRLSGDTWVNVGQSHSVGLFPSLSFAPDGTPYQAFSASYGYGLNIKSFTTDWFQVGDTASVAGSTVNSSKLIVAADGTPYVAYSADGNRNKVSVKKFVSGKWQFVGSSGFTNPGASTVTMALVPDGTVYVAYRDSTIGYKVVVQQFKNGNWSVAGTGAVSKGESDYFDLAIAPDLTPYLAFNDAGNGQRATVAQLVNGNWVTIGAGAISPGASQYEHIAIDKNSVPYITYQDYALSDKVIVKKFTNGQWNDVGQGGASAEESANVSLNETSAGNTYVAFNDALYNGRLSVKTFQSGSWSYVGQPGISQGNVIYLSLATAPDGTPYVIYRDTATKSYAALVKKFDGSAWVQLGGAVTTGYAGETAALSIAPDGTPYVAFQDNYVGGLITVKRYTGGAWSTSGIPTYSEVSITNMNMCIDKNKSLYLGYASLSTQKTNVKKFDGSTWTTLGTQDFSPGATTGLNMILAQDGTPFVAYYDPSKGKVAVQEFTNNSWSFVGGAAASDSSASIPKLVFDKNAQLYLGFLQGRADFTSHGVVKKLSQGSWVDAGSNNTIMPWTGYNNDMTVTPNGDLLYAYVNPEVFVRIKSSDSLAAAPVVTSCTPGYGGTGTVVTINGFNFSKATAVKFGQTAAQSYTVVSPTVIRAVVGAGASGLLSVTTSYGTGTLDGFIFSAAPPVITSFSPHSGNINSTVTILGKHFGALASDNIVYFGSVRAAVISANDSTLTVAVPAGGTYKPISVTTRQLTGYSDSPFITTFKGQAAFNATSFAAKKDFTTVLNPTGLAAVDIDNDGKTDISVTNYNGNQVVLQNSSNINSISLTGKNNINGGGYALASADFDGDGKMDFAYARIPEVTLTKNVSTLGTIALGGIEYYQTTDYPFDISTADLDGDGRPDVITANNQASHVTILRNSSSTKDYIYLENQINLTLDAFPNSLTVADLDGDGKPEIIAVIPNNSKFDGSCYVIVFKNTSTPHEISFTKIAQLSAGINSGRPVVADIDNDGKPEIIVTNAGSNTVSVFKNLTTSTIAFAASTDFPTGNKPQAVCISDLDGDGKPDMAVVNLTDNTVSVFKNTSTLNNISFAAKVNYTTGAGPGNVVAADLDGDGAPELIVANSSTNTISVLRNNTPVGPANVITFGALANATYGDADITLVATSTDMVTPISFISSDSTVVRISGNKAHIVKAGNVIITARQKNGTAAPATETLSVLPAKLTITADNKARLSGVQNPPLTVSYTGFVNGDGSGSLTTQPIITTTAITSSPSGTYQITARGAVNSNYSITYVDGSLTVEFTLPVSNFNLTITSATCRGSNNGSVNITAAQNLNYTATITGNGLNTPYPFTTSADINNLAAGTYNVCITVAGQANYSQCYSVIIAEPKDLSVYSTINSDNSITLALSGANQYNIQLNGQLYTTANSSITLPLAQGNNDLTVTTDRLCQGAFQKLINNSGNITPYPVPFQNTLNLNLGNKNINNVSVEIHDVSDGKLVYSKQYVNQSGVLQLDVTSLNNSVYVLHLTMDNSEKIFKVIKK